MKAPTKNSHVFGRALRATSIAALCAGAGLALAGCEKGADVKSMPLGDSTPASLPSKSDVQPAAAAKPATPAPAPTAKPAESAPPPASEKPAGEKACGGEKGCGGDKGCGGGKGCGKK